VKERGGVKAFLASPMGRIALVVLATLTLLGSFLYLGPFLAIPTFLLFGLAVPIYTGWKRPRQLAAAGLVVLLVAAPVASLAESSSLRTPVDAASSSTDFPYGNGSPVLERAIAVPFTGAEGGSYNFTVTVNPQNVPTNDSAPLWVDLFVSTCPGATGNASPICAPGYPFYEANRTMPNPFNASLVVNFTLVLPGANLWWWQMGAAVHTPANSSNLTWIFLDVSNGYGGVQGPVSGDYVSTLALVLVPVYEAMFLYPGSVFFFALLIYLLVKSREARRRREASLSGAELSGTPPPADAPVTTPVAPKPGPAEKACPNCGAVVFPNETNCWKCGVALTSATSAPAPPLKSG